MASRRLSEVWERKGSMLIERESNVGARLSLRIAGFVSIDLTEVGGARVPFFNSEGI